MEQQKFFFTFGGNHYHPESGVRMKDYWIEITGTSEQARDKMVEIFGIKWSMQYNENTFEPKFFPNGCYQKIKIR